MSAVGALLLYNALIALGSAEHATVGSIVNLGQDIWLGWLMLAAQIYSLFPPLFIGRKELPLAEALNDKLLHTDALMNKANGLTGAAGLAGIIGLGLGWWWADTVAAAIISVDVLNDGIKARYPAPISPNMRRSLVTDCRRDFPMRQSGCVRQGG